MINIILISMFIPILLILMNSILFKKNNLSREKLSPFECGFDPKILPRSPFSLKFYLIAMLFLIFDIEITLIFPIPLLIMATNHFFMTLLTSFFISILLLGLFYEWNEGALNWLK